MGKTVGHKILKLEDFRFLVYDVAGMVNSGPLTYIHDEITSTVIRPMDFLQCADPTGIAPVGAFDDPDYVSPQER